MTKATSTIWLVQGHHYAKRDAYSWPVRCFADKEQAQKLADELTIASRDVNIAQWPHGTGAAIEALQRLEDWLLEQDPQWDYLDPPASYSVDKIELVGTEK